MKRGLTAVAGVATVGLVAALGWALATDKPMPFLAPDLCTATVDGRNVDLSLQQAENAGLIAAIGVQRGLPARAVTIALATAYQESKILDLEGGDRDSIGLFQQRPSQGWGTPEQVGDPVYATHAFYDALERIDGYTDMEVTVAAQAVQRSAYPDAYADHEADARVLASALTGHSPAALSCRLDPDVADGNPRLRASGLTARAEEVRRDLDARFPDAPLGGFEPGGVSTGHQQGSAHYEGRAIDLFVRPISAANRVRGWAIAQYLVTQAERLRIRTLIFDGRIWTSGFRSGDGWRDYDVDTDGRPAGTAAILEHRDHVHVDVHD
ncbi:hypothetical protein [Nocardioides sp. SYSU D00038]|uniref:hypothetical protein n=1 Tax=Nocardioides sp. SYSU D00038 TaxID=2812554 RepID=UPI00196746FD|nr:hypothetical protein [Nocardioides sp. SYSU D00038]